MKLEIELYCKNCKRIFSRAEIFFDNQKKLLKEKNYWDNILSICQCPKCKKILKIKTY